MSWPDSSARMLKCLKRAVQSRFLCLAIGLTLTMPMPQAKGAPREYLSGYLIIPISGPTGGRVDRSYNAGYSMYIAAWPLLRSYPGHRFQTGLPGTWMFAQYDGPKPKNLYSDIEGGLGSWRETRFPTQTPKFIMGGVDPNFGEIANGPGMAGAAETTTRVFMASPN